MSVVFKTSATISHHIHIGDPTTQTMMSYLGWATVLTFS